jgi:hypothetical protein
VKIDFSAWQMENRVLRDSKKKKLMRIFRLKRVEIATGVEKVAHD